MVSLGTNQNFVQWSVRDNVYSFHENLSGRTFALLDSACSWTYTVCSTLYNFRNLYGPPQIIWKSFKPIQISCSVLLATCRLETQVVIQTCLAPRILLRHDHFLSLTTHPESQRLLIYWWALFRFSTPTLEHSLGNNARIWCQQYTSLLIAH